MALKRFRYALTISPTSKRLGSTRKTSHQCIDQSQALLRAAALEEAQDFRSPKFSYNICPTVRAVTRTGLSSTSTDFDILLTINMNELLSSTQFVRFKVFSSCLSSYFFPHIVPMQAMTYIYQVVYTIAKICQEEEFLQASPLPLSKCVATSVLWHSNTSILIDG